MSAAPVLWSMAPTGAADGLGDAVGALDDGGAEALAKGDAPLELQATTASARTGSRAWRVNAGMAPGRRIGGIGSLNGAGTGPERGKRA